MGFFDETVSKAKDALDVVGKKTNEVISVQKLKLNAKTLEGKIENEYALLGKLCYEKFTGESENIQFAEESVKRINDLKDELAKLRDDICVAQGGKCCPSCESLNEKDAAFCKNCGQQL